VLRGSASPAPESKSRLVAAAPVVVVTASGIAGLKRDRRRGSCWCACAGQRRCRCPGDSLGVRSKSSCFDRLGTDAVGWPGEVAPDLGDVVELLRKSLMSVPERASVTAKQASRPDRREAGVVGSWNGTDRPRAAVGRQGQHRNVPATVSPRSCVRAARARGYALRQRRSPTRPRRRQGKRVSALWDQAERKWYAPHPAIEALERRLPFVDLVTWSCWFTNVRACLGIRLHPPGRLGISTVPPDMLRATAGADRGRPWKLLLPDGRPFGACRWWWPMPSHASRWPGQVASRNPENLTRAVRAPSGSGSTPAWAEPRA
jgi:hypothetical protein